MVGNMWVIKYKRLGKEEIMQSDSTGGILSAIEEFVSKGWKLWQIVSIHYED